MVEAIVILPQNMFYTTNISVTLWILNKNKTEHIRNIGDVSRNYRNRKDEILFMDLRQIGVPFEKNISNSVQSKSMKLLNLITTGNNKIKAMKMFQNIVTAHILMKCERKTIP